MAPGCPTHIALTGLLQAVLQRKITIFQTNCKTFCHFFCKNTQIVTVP